MAGDVVVVGGEGPDTAAVEAEAGDYNYNYDYDSGHGGHGGGHGGGGGECADGEYSAPAASCSSFYQCVNGEQRLKQCYEGLHWNKEKQTCDWPEAAGCTTRE